MSEYQNIAISQIKENPDALRQVDTKREEFLELCKSISAQGVLQPIIVRKAEGEDKYILIDGAHRFTASRELGLDTIPARVMAASDMDAYEMQMVTNLQQIKTRPAEFASQLRRMLMRDPLLTGPKLCARLGKSEPWLDGMLRLTKLSEKHKVLVNEGNLGLTNAQALAQLPEEERDSWLDRALTLSPADFKPLVDQRMKEIRKAKSEGRDPTKPAEFAPLPRLRKVSEIKELFEQPGALNAIITTATSPQEAARQTVAWILHMDAVSIEAQKVAFEQRKTEKESDKKENATRRTKEKIEAARKRLAELEAGTASEGEDE